MIDSNAFELKYTENISDYRPLAALLKAREPSVGSFSHEDLQAIQQNFCELLYYRCRNADDCLQWLDEQQGTLPSITNELLSKDEPEWLPIPGMYGGFSFGLIERNGKPVLIADSWVRVVGGSGQTHEVTPAGITLTAEGYV